MKKEFKFLEHLLEGPEQQTKKGAILIPGISGNAITLPFYQSLAEEMKKSGFSLLRFNIWESKEELEILTIKEIQEIIDQAVEYMKSSGINNIALIGKSFGGLLTLTYQNSEIKSKILIAPAVNIALQSNFQESRSLELKNFKNYEAIKLNSKDINHNLHPILIIQGTKDEVVKKEQSEKIYEILHNSKIEYINHADHSFSKQEDQKLVINKIISFLKKNI